MKGLEQLNLETAKFDIICYKVVKVLPRPWYKKLYKKQQVSIVCTKRKFIRGTALNSDVRVLIPEHCGQKLSLNVAKHYKCGTSKTEKTIPEYIVTEGVHAFISYTDAIEYCNKFKNAYVCRCEVPRKSLYYYGKFGNAVGIIANAIKITKVLQ